MDKKKIKIVLVFSLAILLMAILTIILWPYIVSLAKEETRIQLKEYLDSIGIGGWFLMLGIQILQIVIAFLPGEAVELVMGAIYGPWLGLFTCLLGILIGSIIVYFLARLIGKPFVRLFVKDEDLKKYKFLQNPMKVEMTVFILFFIPGTPKDVLTYISPMVPIKPLRFFLIATFARIPSVITSTIMGDQFISGNYEITILVFVITALISITGIIINNRFINKKQNEKNKTT